MVGQDGPAFYWVWQGTASNQRKPPIPLTGSSTVSIATLRSARSSTRSVTNAQDTTHFEQVTLPFGLSLPSRPVQPTEDSPATIVLRQPDWTTPLTATMTRNRAASPKLIPSESAAQVWAVHKALTCTAMSATIPSTISIPADCSGASCLSGSTRR